MKKIIKILTVMFALLLVSTFAFACGDNNKQDPPEHTHNFSSGYKSDVTHHWFECDCGEKKDVKEHVFVDGVCGCGYKKAEEHVHSFDKLEYDKTNHWNECKCGEVSGLEAHAGGKATCEDLAVCDKCKQEYGELKEHEYSVTDYDSIKHWLECKDCEKVKDYALHTFTDNKCDCGYEKAVQPEDHKHTTGDWQVDTEPTCTTKGVKYKACTDCGDVVETEEIPMIPHSYVNDKHDEENHWKECMCGDKKDVTAHAYTTAPLELDPMVDRCSETWYSAKKICGCGYEELVKEKPINHKGYAKGLRVSSPVTQDKGSTLVGNCNLCGADVVVSIPSLNDDAKSNSPVYVKSSKVGSGNFHIAEYVYTYEGEKYNVVGNDYKEYHITKIDDYTKEKYPELKLIADQELSCAKDAMYVDMAYICADCDAFVLVDVKVVVHGMYLKEPKIVPTDKSDCSKGGSLVYECAYCDEIISVENVDTLEHEWVLKEGTSPIEVKDKGGNIIGFNLTVKCSNCNVKEKTVKADSFTLPTCKAGSVIYGGISFILPGTGRHNIEGVGIVEETGVCEYEKVKDVAKLIAGEKVSCNNIFQMAIVCDKCNLFIVLDVARAHEKVWTKISSTGTCVNPGEELFNCGYADCPYYVADEKDYGKKNVGTAPIYGGHDLSYADVVFDAEQESKEYKTGKFTVLCANNCSINNTTDVAFKLYEDRTLTCVDYKQGLCNYDKYSFEFDGENYEIILQIENSIHVLNGKKIDVYAQVFTIGDAGIKKISGSLANCKSIGEGGFDCDLCGDIAKVQLTGKCVEPAQTDKVFITDSVVGCETPRNKYWVCQLCQKKHFEEQLAPAQGHEFEYTISADKNTATLNCVTTSCDCELCGKPIVVNLEKLTPNVNGGYYVYAYTYESRIVDGYTQTVIIKVPV